jgi:hypothetical protein
MAAPKGNQFWKLRSKHGRDKIWKDPQVLLDACYDYFQECDENPWYKNDAVRSGKDVGKVIQIPTQRPYTKAGLCVYLGINQDTWSNYKNGDDKDMLGVITHVEEIIEQNQLEGATVGAYNPNIVARLLGLKDRSEVENKHSGQVQFYLPDNGRD